ncbi:hypothetical protein TrispH2_000726 [Trichoplax sp. H2]|nr:hypothetical protein TrispH2_000726 [Trichoplax sp. H2]|eukprot:RDD47596.1 hypothetical protein TrispH2_000726 [Trichoplax sp. H2]
MICFSNNKMWIRNVIEPLSQQHYVITIRLRVDVGLCGCQTPYLFINEFPHDIDISWCNYTPFYNDTRGSFKFEELGHAFEIICNSWLPSINASNYVMFIDGKEYYSDATKRDYYLRYFVKMLAISVLILVPTIILSVFGLLKYWSIALISVLLSFAVIAFIYSVIGLIGTVTFLLRPKEIFDMAALCDQSQMMIPSPHVVLSTNPTNNSNNNNILTEREEHNHDETSLNELLIKPKSTNNNIGSIQLL